MEKLSAQQQRYLSKLLLENEQQAAKIERLGDEIERLRALLKRVSRWMNDGHELREPSKSELRALRNEVHAAYE